MLYTFLDTNIFLQYQTFDEIDWPTQLNAKEVCLVVPRKVIQELDKHKHDPVSNRRRKRARLCLRKLMKYWRTDDKKVRDNTTLLIQTSAPNMHWLNENGYQAEDADDTIVAAVHFFSIENPKDRVALFADDYGVRLKALANNIDTIEPPNKLQLSDEPDPLQKENQKLQRQLYRLQNAQPKLSMHFRDDSSLTDEIEFLVDFSQIMLSDDEIAKTLAEKLEDLTYTGKIEGEVANTENESVDSIYPLALPEISLGINRIYPKRNEVDKYHESVKKYLQDEYKAYLSDDANYQILEKRTRSIQLVLENSGTVPAQNIDIWLHFPDGFELSEYPTTEPEMPKAPNMPKAQSPLDGINLALSSMRHDYHVPYVNRDYTTPPSPPSISIRKTNSYEVEWSTDNLKHHFVWNWPELYLTFEKPDKGNKVFEVKYQIIADNVPDKIEGRLLIKLSAEDTN